MPIRIDELDPSSTIDSGYVVPTMRAGQTLYLTMGQIADFIIDLISDGSPAALDTLKELATALGNDDDFAATMTTALAGKQPSDAMLTALAALTSANGQFLAFSGVGSPVVRSIVGTVSQVAGVPTGALIETGSNANGKYTRFADGTQMCWHQVSITTASAGIWASLAWTFPASFNDGTVRVVSSQGSPVSNQVISSGATGGSPTVGTIYLVSETSAVGAQSIDVFAVGRWF
jgi:hypothetical protein